MPGKKPNKQASRVLKEKQEGEKEKRPGKGLGDTLPEDQVRLPVLLGVKPKQYLAALYGSILAGGIFLLFFFPGLSNPGGVLAVESEPRGAAVRIGGVYQGTAPCELFIPQGTWEIELVLPGFIPRKTEVSIRGRRFASLLFPRRFQISLELTARDSEAPLLAGAREFAEWSFTGEPTADYQIPLSLSEGAYRAGPLAADPEIRRNLEAILEGSLRFGTTRSALRDLSRAKHLIDNGGRSPSPLTLIRSAQDMLQALSAAPSAAAWLADLLPADTAASLIDASWYAKAVEDALPEEQAPRPRGDAPFGGSLSLGGLAFREIAGGGFADAPVFPRPAILEDFWIAETEVTRESWDAFLRDTPAWAPANRETLRQQGWITGDYLQALDAKSEFTVSGVPGISWYAAAAYCRWLTALLPPGMAGAYEARLPRETEWEYAARLVASRRTETPQPGLPRDLFNGLWEWCADPFAPLPLFPAQEGVIEKIASPERSLRGGSWINPPGSVSPETRASLPPRFCSPFVSFRPVIAPREAP